MRIVRYYFNFLGQDAFRLESQWHFLWWSGWTVVEVTGFKSTALSWASHYNIPFPSELLGGGGE